MSFNKNVDAGSASLASVAMGSNGEVYVVIQQVDSTTGQNNINFNHCAPNRGWGAATLVDNLSGDADYPKIAVNGVIMPSVSGVRSMVVQPIFMPAIVPQVAFGKHRKRLKPSMGLLMLNPVIVMNSSSTAFAVWVQADSVYENR